MNEREKLTIGSLFSGIGGLELGLERTGGFRTVWNSEIDEYASAVLRKHWPGTPNLGDITKIDWEKVERPDLICGGFPCQDISAAGKGAGIKEGTRSGLWFEFHKAIRVLRPRYALVENVSALSFRGLSIVLADLAEIRYNAEWFTLQAREVGAPHKRERLFIVAHANSGGWGTGNDSYGTLSLRTQTQRSENVSSDGNGRERRLDKLSTLQPADSERVGRGGRVSERGGTEREFLGGREGNGDSVRRETEGRDSFETRSVEPTDPSDDGLERLTAKSLRRFPEFQKWEDIRRVEDLAGRSDIPEPLIRGGDNGVPCWVDRIKCLGNAVVPQVAQVIGEAILQNEERSGV